MSERRACVVVGQRRSTQRLRAPVPERRGDSCVPSCATSRSAIPAGAGAGPPTRLRDAGWQGERQADPAPVARGGPEGPLSQAKKPLRGIGVVVGAMCPIAPNVIWAMDFQFDQTSDRRTMKLLNIIDEFTRESASPSTSNAPSTPTASSTGLDRLALERGAPCLPALRQRARVRRPCAGRLVPVQRRRHRSSSTRAHPGRTAGSNRSTAGCVTSS